MSGALLLATIAAFDLICVGTSTQTKNGVEQRPAPLESRLRIDLDADRWCGGPCDETAHFEKIEERKLTFFDQNIGSFVNTLTINRESGAYFFYRLSGRDAEIATAHCERAPFSGFPARKF
ncbi:hypothetical protein BH10PSE14_BH10PSE14_28990 [soil metagenome]